MEGWTGPDPRPALRVGRKVGRTVYQQLGDLPSDSDRLIGLMDTRGYAEGVVAAVNAAGPLRWALERMLERDPADELAAEALLWLRPVLDSGLVLPEPGDLPAGD